MGMLDAMKKAGLVSKEAASAVEQEKQRATEQEVRDNLERLANQKPARRTPDGPQTSE